MVGRGYNWKQVWGHGYKEKRCPRLLANDSDFMLTLSDGDDLFQKSDGDDS